MKRLRAIFFRNHAEIDEELAHHLELQTRKHIAAGMPPEDAARAARLDFGTDPGAVRDYVRDTRRSSFFETLLQDIRYALRGFRRAPLFALTVIGTIAIGLGWNTAAFTIFNAYLLHPVQARDPYSLYAVGWQDSSGQDHPMTWRQIEDLRVDRPGFQGMTATFTLRLRMEGRFAVCTLVDGEYFRLLGIKPAIGRTLLPSDLQKPGASPAAVISYRTWQDRFGSASDILGRKILLQGRSYTIVGVMPEGFTGLGKFLPNVWTALDPSASFQDPPGKFDPDQPSPINLAVRLNPGESVEQSRTALSAWMQRQAPAQMPHADLMSLATPVAPSARDFAALIPLAIVFLLVLLSACANVANMLLARAMSRQREIGIRLSIGAGRGRLIRQLLTESILLAIPAAAAALGVSQLFLKLGMRWLFATFPPGLADQVRMVPLSLDVHTFWFMVGAAVAVALLFGVAPALQATRLDVMQAARGDFDRGFRPARLRNALVVAQVAVCGFLLSGAAVLLRADNHIKHLDPGMRTKDVVEIELRDKQYARALETLRVHPDVALLAASSDSPIDSTHPTVAAAGSPVAGPVQVPYQYISPEYFHVLDTPILRGRTFTEEDVRAQSAVAILSESAARKLWPGEDAFGHFVNLPPPDSQVRGGRPPHDHTVQVIGIVRDPTPGNTNEFRHNCLYLPTGVGDPRNALLVRVHGNPAIAVRNLNATLESATPGAVDDIHLLQDFVAASIWTYWVGYCISAVLGGIALLLTLSGIYGVLAYVVAQRRKEIGIRMALGASARGVTALVMAQCLRLAGIGIALGCGLALAAGKLLSAISADVQIDAIDAVSYLGAFAVVLGACLAAAFIPAHRASRVDPITTLRYD